MNSEILEKVLAYVDTHIYEKISLSELSEIARYSPFYFSRLFSETMGMPITAYIRIRKLQYAIVSLLEGHKVLDVAFMYAFESHEGFTRAFTQLFGSTPSTARKHLTSYTVPEYVVPTISSKKIRNMETMKLMDLQYNMHQLVFEFLEESFKEAKAGYCNKIEVVLLSGCMVKISDNGRGIALSKELHASKVVLDKILAGSPISNAEYSQMGDLLQVGMQTVNSLCERLHISVNNGGKQFQQDYIRGIAQHDIYISDSVSASGTEIISKPDTAIFGNTVFSKEMLCDWVNNKIGDIPNLKVDVKSMDIE
jgi:Type IIA topoisomerase (DNA gyrase/topo II, topoisomerase IV), B subunit